MFEDKTRDKSVNRIFVWKTIEGTQPMLWEKIIKGVHNFKKFIERTQRRRNPFYRTNANRTQL